MVRLSILTLVIAGCLLALGCSNEIDAPSGVSTLPPQPETPRGLTASIGDNQVALSWTVTTAATIDRYKVYFSDSLGATGQIFDSTAETGITVTGLVNGREYYFQVSAVTVDGLEGEKSRSTAATPGIFSISLASGAEYYNQRTVGVSLTAPTGTGLVQLSEDSDFTGAHWETYSPARSFLLSDNDGVKTVYARFQLAAGGNSIGYVSDEITLDRVATIVSVLEDTGGDTLTAGDHIEFHLVTTETGGSASVEVVGLGIIQLNDDGFGGDGVADDMSYEFIYTLPIGIELTEAEVIGRFIDAAGNQAPERKAISTINATYPPEAVQLGGYAESSLDIVLEWSRSAVTDFASYRLFRSNSAGGTGTLVTTIPNQATVGYRDTALAAATPYYYTIYVYDSRGNNTVSNEVALTTLTNAPPDPVTIAVGLTGETQETQITWLQAGDADFKAYHLLRSASAPSGYSEDLVVNIINNRATTQTTDNVPTAGTYYYQVFVFDKQGENTGSNVVTVAVP